LTRAGVKRFDGAAVTPLFRVLLTKCRAMGWRGRITGSRGGLRLRDREPGSRHARSIVKKLGQWSQAVDVTDPEGLIRAAASLDVTLRQTHLPSEPSHVEAAGPFVLVPRKGGAAMSAADRRLVNVMRAHGIVYPAITLREARKSGLPLHYACAMLQKETGGGKNEFGHDPVRPPQIIGGSVTPWRYAFYRFWRRRGHGNQGVGPCQLTSSGFQDRADALGGCHRPGPNMRVGFSTLRALIAAFGPERGAARYNGSGPAADAYGADFLRKAHAWRIILTS
jgi:hypothetical protein